MGPVPGPNTGQLIDRVAIHRQWPAHLLIVDDPRREIGPCSDHPGVHVHIIGRRKTMIEGRPPRDYRDRFRTRQSRVYFQARVAFMDVICYKRATLVSAMSA